MAIFYIARKIIQAAEGKEMNIPLEYKKLDFYGDHDGHVDFEDVKAIGANAIDDVENIASGVSDFVDNVGEHVGNVLEHLLGSIL